MKLVVLTGIPGSGSTTLLNKALEEVDYVHLNYGDIMTEIAIEEKIVDDRDALRKLSPDVQKEIQEKAAKRIKERAKDIQLHQEMNRAASMAYATLTGATVKIIENHDNHLPSTVSKLVDVLNK